MFASYPSPPGVIECPSKYQDLNYLQIFILISRNALKWHPSFSQTPGISLPGSIMDKNALHNPGRIWWHKDKASLEEQCKFSLVYSPLMDFTNEIVWYWDFPKKNRPKINLFFNQIHRTESQAEPNKYTLRSYEL